MKTLKNMFRTEETKKSMNHFSNKLDLSTMIMIKGGEIDPDEDLWPPKTVTKK